MSTDKRFSKILKDPRFKRMPRRFRRVKIDSRFNSMFSDSKFKTKYSVDKRGRPIKRTSKEDLEKFYEVDKNTVNENEDAPVESSNPDKKFASTSNAELPLKKALLDVSESDSNDDEDDDGDMDFSDIRGGVNSSSSSDEEEDLDTIEDQVVDHDWGELDKDATRKENAVTSRLAACNLDWDRVTAKDLFVLFSSFGGVIKSVKIYLSEFGKQRLAEEDLNGPKELADEIEEDQEEEGDPNNVEGSTFHMEKLRMYQLNRLKYYYAIVECNAKETASKIYDECDGMEYELSATRLDLRFVPDEMTFEDNPTQIATEMPMLSNYQPTNFSNTALQQSTVRLTWDETDQKRLQMTMRKFDKDELMDMDFKAYLASSSEDENDEKEATVEENANVNDSAKNEEEDKIKKYRDLLKDIESKEKKDDGERHMEISWTPALSEATEQIVKDKIEKEQEKAMTPWEKYQKDKKKKTKANKKTAKTLDGEERSEEANEDASEKEEYIPTGADDPFFVHGDGEDTKASTKKKRKNRSKKNEDQSRENEAGNSHGKSELELLIMDENDDKQHFSMKQIIENEARKKKRKRGKKKEAEQATVDNFEIDVKDSRFNALFNSPDYILDPSDPQFKKTKAMEKLIQEKQKRRKETTKIATGGSEASSSKQNKLDPSLSFLIKNVKTRTEELMQRKKAKS
ncbi:ESF1 homolog [Rhopilema esculentum]|uniref:ESF1 homolog n=1 Tax=Rhopilema esculentum TaxID=499914 RepID=UPI0031D57FF6